MEVVAGLELGAGLGIEDEPNRQRLKRLVARQGETIGGFSDGATYAVSLGLINGDLFRRVVAFSPGFVIPGETQGKPRFFISHGTEDKILPIDRCRRVIVSRLQKRGYDVTFREFDGGHEIPAAIAREGMTWMAATG